jgi:hypothetical protein
MRRLFALILALGMFVVFSGVALADGSGMCSYSAPTQASTEKTDAAKPVATKSTDKIDADKLLLAQTEKSNKPVSEPKK